jgi:hypothetical protein
MPTAKEIHEAADNVPVGECCDLVFFERGRPPYIIHVDKTRNWDDPADVQQALDKALKDERRVLSLEESKTAEIEITISSDKEEQTKSTPPSHQTKERPMTTVIDDLKKVAQNIARGCEVNATPGEIIASTVSDLEKVFDLPPRVPGLMAQAMLVQHLHTAKQAAIHERMVWELCGHNVE